MRIALLLVTCAVICSAALAQDYEEETSRFKLRSPRGPVIPNRSIKQQIKPSPSSTTPEPAPQPEEEGELYDDFYEEGQGAEAKETTTTTTEAPKKGIRGGVVRPFRSNTDLIEALKRRRAQISNEKSVSTHAPPTSSTTTEPSKAPNNRQSKNLSNNRKFSRNSADKQLPSTESPVASEEPTQRSRLFAAGRGRRF